MRQISPFLLLLPLAMVGCSGDYSPNTYTPNAVQQAAKVDQGVIVGVRRVDVTSNGALGAASGAAAGGIIGAQSPGGGMGSAIGAVGGSLVGGLIGTTVEHVATDTTAFEYIVRKKTGEMISVTQKDKVPLVIGQGVLVIAGPQARVVVDYTVPPPEPEKPVAEAPKPAAPPPAPADSPAAAAKQDSMPADVAAIVAKLPEPHLPEAASPAASAAPAFSGPASLVPPALIAPAASSP